MFSESYSYFWSFCLFVVLSFWFSALVYLLLFISVHASSFQLIGICLEALSPFCCIFVFLSLCHCVFLSQFVLVHLSSFQFIGTRLEAFLLFFRFLSHCLSVLVCLSSSLVHLSSFQFIGGRPGIIWGLISSFRFCYTLHLLFSTPS